jgi:hypothetical protein
MNKNWLYRILAIALVAMLALPVFAMAEEVDTFELGAAELEEKKLDYDPQDAVEWDPEDPDINPFDFDEGSKTYACNIDLGNLSWDNTVFKYVNAMSTFKKTNSNSKVVTVSQRGTISLTGKTGKAKLTFTAKGAHTEEKATCTINLNVKNTAKIKVNDWVSSIAAFIQPDDQPTYEMKYDGDKDPDNVDRYYLTFKSSNKDSVEVDFETGELHIKKPGKATITIREYYEHEEGERPLLVCTLKKTITVKPNKYTDTKEDEKACAAAAKADEDLYVGVRSAEFTKFDEDAGTGTLKVTLFIVNGTANPIKKIYGGPDGCNVAMSLVKYETAREKRLNINGDAEVLAGGTYLEADKSKSVNWKANAKNIGTLTMEIKEVPIKDLTGDLKQVVVDMFEYRTTKKDLDPTQIWIKEY